MAQVAAPMTPEAFLGWEARQELKWEFDGFRPVAMVGGTFAHTRIQGNLITSLNNRLRDKPCIPCGPDMRVPTGSGRCRYPDALVTCAPMPPEAVEAPEPVIVFEVLSESTQLSDRTTKLVEYRTIPTLRRYVMIEQREAAVTVITRAGAIWSIDVLRGGGLLEMPEIGIGLPVDELYAGVEFPPPPE